jgi:hypothetical protein
VSSGVVKARTRFPVESAVRRLGREHGPVVAMAEKTREDQRHGGELQPGQFGSVERHENREETERQDRIVVVEGAKLRRRRVVQQGREHDRDARRVEVVTDARSI